MCSELDEILQEGGLACVEVILGLRIFKMAAIAMETEKRWEN